MKIENKSEQIPDTLAIKPVYSPSNNKLYYQTEPFIDVDGKLKIIRLAEYNVEVENFNSKISNVDDQN